MASSQGHGRAIGGVSVAPQSPSLTKHLDLVTELPPRAFDVLLWRAQWEIMHVIDEALSSLYGTMDGSVTWPSALQALMRVTGAERISAASAGRDGSYKEINEPFDPDGAVVFLRDYADKDLRIARIMEGRRGALSTRDLMSPAEIARCPVHNEFYKMYPECWHMMAFPLEGESKLFSPLIHRRANKGEFTREEARKLQVLSQHLARVLEVKDALSSTTLANDGILAAYDALDDGIVIFDQAGIVLHMNALARRLAASRDGITLQNGVLTAADTVSSDALLRMMTSTIKVAAGEQYDLPKPIGIRRQSSPHPLIVRSYVVPNSNPANRIGVIKLQERSAWNHPTAETIQAATGLTKAEAMLALALLDGVSVVGYAKANDLSEHTVRTHMKNILSKLGLTRQVEVVTLLARLSSG
ncbi:MAG TPA: helix-turn-helix transcriptional regulator [Aurantimonas sp.]|jgi:DNA-binding CsgD family transcriptional regulator/PAS domain-containing protein|nr:helix-turn-helix transcriptional regulator [Aurantimonas sp.]